jgi:hypothetical protein
MELSTIAGTGDHSGRSFAPSNTARRCRMSFVLYVLGFLIVIVGVALGAHYMHVPAHWIAVVVIILAGIGVATGVSHTRYRDPF